MPKASFDFSRLRFHVPRPTGRPVSGLVSRLIPFLSVLTVVLLAGAGPLRAETDETALFMNGYQAHLQGEDEKAIATLNDVIKKHPKGKMTDLALYWLGKTLSLIHI